MDMNDFRPNLNKMTNSDINVKNNGNDFGQQFEIEIEGIGKPKLKLKRSIIWESSRK